MFSHTPAKQVNKYTQKNIKKKLCGIKNNVSLNKQATRIDDFLGKLNEKIDDIEQECHGCDSGVDFDGAHKDRFGKYYTFCNKNKCFDYHDY
jgi:hypothetical protein